ncbi:hypothetical protein CIP107565_01729 [Corynebacterium diphtheriae]|nr:hypothetical protein CIP107565_01729 [Corynebacterium diphtheriae]
MLETWSNFLTDLGTDILNLSSGGVLNFFKDVYDSVRNLGDGLSDNLSA